MANKLNNIAQLLKVGDKVHLAGETFVVVGFMLHLDMIFILIKDVVGDITTVKPHGLFKVEEEQ